MQTHRPASMGRELVVVFQNYLLFLFSWNNSRIVCCRSAPAGGAPTEGGAPQQPPNLTSNRRLQQTQAQVDEVSAHPILLLYYTDGAHDAIVILGILSSGAGAQLYAARHTRRLDNCLSDIVLHLFPQVVDIMRVNVDKVLERDQKLSELDDRADALQAGASQFETSAAKLKNKYWWKNAKVREADVLSGYKSNVANLVSCTCQGLFSPCRHHF